MFISITLVHISMPTLYKHPFLRKYIVIVGPFQSNIAYHHPSLKLIKLASRISFQSTIFYQKNSTTKNVQVVHYLEKKKMMKR